MQKKRSLMKWAALAAVCVIPALVAGCSGGNGTNPFGGGGVVQNGTFSGASANLGANRTGTFALKTFSDNTISGTLVVTTPPALRKSSATSNALVTLPIGAYHFTGTRTGNSFTGTGTIPGTSSIFTISGSLSTSASAGNFSFTGNINGEPFDFTGTINVTTGGGTGGGNDTFTFSNGGSNANTGSFSSIAAVGAVLNFNGTRLLQGSFPAATNATNLRVVSYTLGKTSAFAAGDTFTVSDDNDVTSGFGVVLYAEGAPATKSWVSHSGTAEITAISGTKVTVKLTNVLMQPAPASPLQPNQATGSFTLSGTSSANYTGL